MAPKYVEPKLGADSFSCPHCGTFSHQTWCRTFIDPYDGGEKPTVLLYDNADVSLLDKIEDDAERKNALNFFNRLKKNDVTYDTTRFGKTVRREMVNVFMSQCFSCKGFTVWIKESFVYPPHKTEIEAHDEMPGPIKEIFNEAASIVNESPRGASALIRLGFQELMPFLGEDGKNLNDDIASLVKKGLEPAIQKAMDALRVIGNNAVHPGVIDLKDDKSTAVALFDLLNLIVERRIAVPNRIDEIYGMLPPGAVEAIEKRDKKDK